MKYLNQQTQLVNWLKVMRVSQGFFFISAMPVILGVSMVAHHTGTIVSPALFFLMLFGALVFHLGADMINEYYDHISGNDALVDIKTPFSGGTRVLEDGLLKPKKVLYISWVFFLVGSLLALGIAKLTNETVLIFSACGLISCWGYSAPPLKFCYRGLGEIIILLNNGFFILGAVFMALTETFDLRIVFPSLFLGFLGFAIILMNEVPDYRADKQVNKKNLVVRLGIKNALILHKVAICIAFGSLIMAVALKHLPWPCLAGLIGPLLVSDKKIYRMDLMDKTEDGEALTGLCKSTIELKFKSWLLVMLGFIINWFIAG